SRSCSVEARASANARANSGSALFQMQTTGAFAAFSGAIVANEGNADDEFACAVVRCGGCAAMTSVSDIPTAHTPPGGYGAAMPAPVVAGCTDALAPEAPDLRGMWKVVDAYNDDGALPAEHPIRQHVERIEQAGNRAVVTADGIIHDMVADGTYENG